MPNPKVTIDREALERLVEASIRARGAVAAIWDRPDCGPNTYLSELDAALNAVQSELNQRYAEERPPGAPAMPTSPALSQTEKDLEDVMWTKGLKAHGEKIDAEIIEGLKAMPRSAFQGPRLARNADALESADHDQDVACPYCGDAGDCSRCYDDRTEDAADLAHDFKKENE